MIGRQADNLLIRQESPQQSSGILKFVNQKSSATKIEGKKCNPYRQFGISSDAPKQFCTKHSLVADMKSYRQAKEKLVNGPEFYSQKNFFKINHQTQRKARIQQNQFPQKFSESHEKNKIAFHQTSSKITQFFDKNAWMGSRFHVMGHERSENAREISKVTAQINSRSARNLHLSRKKSMTPFTTRTISGYPTHQSMKTLIMSEKSKIRTMRNAMAQSQHFQFKEQEVVRPHTSLQINRSYKINSQRERKVKQFEVRIPQWGDKQFEVKHMQWNPERNKESGQVRLVDGNGKNCENKIWRSPILSRKTLFYE